MLDKGLKSEPKVKYQEKAKLELDLEHRLMELNKSKRYYLEKDKSGQKKALIFQKKSFFFLNQKKAGFDLREVKNWFECKYWHKTIIPQG